MFFHCHPQFSSLNGKTRQPDPPLLTNPRTSRIAECTHLSSYGHSPTKIIPSTKQVTTVPLTSPDGRLFIRARDNEVWNCHRKPKPDISASRIRFLRPATYVAKLPAELFCLQHPASPSATYVAKDAAFRCTHCGVLTV